jgi:DHA1 family multidrug resistance protein-like MFS transporter
VAHLQFLLASFVWNYGLGMTWLVVPLYAVEQGLSAAEIGWLFSLPVVAQIVINLVGGAYTDRVGGHRVMLAACVLMSAGAVALLYAGGFWTLFLGQGVLVVSRAAFWPANWAIATDLPGDRGTQVGRLNSATYLAQILGNASCGFVLAAGGFPAALAVVVVLGIGSFLFTLGVPPGEPRAKPKGSMFANYALLARMPIVYYALLSAYLSALPMTLNMSFYPLLLKEFGYAESASGVLMALRAMGGIAAGMLLARFVTTGPESRWPVIGGVVVALAVGLFPLQPHWLATGTMLFLVGLGGGVLTLHVQLTVPEVTTLEMRGSALALLGLGWSLSHLTTPLIAGFLAERYGTSTAFYVLGVIAMGFVLAIALTRKWAWAGVTRVAGAGRAR